jgi:DNA-binding response OmpR family regulator
MNERICFLIDDDIDDQEIFTLALKQVRPQFTCFTAGNGYEALEKLDDEHFIPHYIFLDLNMPRMNGKECLREIRKIKHLSHVPVVIYSTSSSIIDIRDTQALGATDFITKPFSIAELNEILTSLFLKYREPLLADRHRPASHHSASKNY